MSRPLVSVIIPVYNAEAHVGQAISSALDQTYENIEVLVVDDGSTDDSADIVESMVAEDTRVEVIRQENKGVAAARNRGIRQAKGEYIAPLDADDRWFMPKLERQVDRMVEGGPALGLVYSWWLYINQRGEIFQYAGRPRFEGDVFEAHVHQNFVGNGSVPLIRRAALENVGLYDEGFRTHGAEGCEDWDLTLRIARQYDFGLVPDHLSVYRRAEDSEVANQYSMSDNTTEMNRSYNRMMSKLRDQHPGLSDELLRWSRANFYDYLANVSYRNRSFSKTLHWLLRLIQTDPASLLSPWVRRTAIKALLRMMMAPSASNTPDVDESVLKQTKS